MGCENGDFHTDFIGIYDHCLDEKMTYDFRFRMISTGMSRIFNMIRAFFAGNCLLGRASEARMVTGHIVCSRAALDFILRADGLGSKTSKK